MKLHIAVLPGDGIGPEVVEQALNVTKAVCEKIRTFSGISNSPGRSLCHRRNRIALPRLYS